MLSVRMGLFSYSVWMFCAAATGHGMRATLPTYLPTYLPTALPWSEATIELDLRAGKSGSGWE